MTGHWRFSAHCPRCDTPLTHVTGSAATPPNPESRAIAHCTTCNERWLLHLTLRSTTTLGTADHQTRRHAS